MTDMKKVTNSALRLATTAKASMGRKLSLTFITAVLSQFLMLILFFVPIGQYAVSAEMLFSDYKNAQSVSLFTATADGITWIMYIVPMLVSITLCVSSIIKYNGNKIYRMIFSKIVTGANAGMICITIIALAAGTAAQKSQLAERYGEEFVKCSWNITFGGWLNLIVTATSMFLLFMISRQTKQNRA